MFRVTSDIHHRRTPCLLLVAALFLSAGGCSSSGPQRASVSGTVLVDGQPLEEGAINFIPADRTKGPSAGGTITKGKYSIDRAKGVVVGTHQVRIQGMRKTGRKVPGKMQNTPVDEYETVLPPDYGAKNPLVREVHAGHNVLDFDLKGRPVGK